MQFSKVNKQQTDIENAKKEIRLLINQVNSIQSEQSLRDQMAEIDAEVKRHIEATRREVSLQARRKAGAPVKIQTSKRVWRSDVAVDLQEPWPPSEVCKQNGII